MAKPTCKKHTEIETEQIFSEVLEMVLNGESSSKIVAECRNKWGLAKRGVEPYITKVNKYFREQANHDRKEQVGKALNRYEKIYKKGIESNLSAAVSAQKALCDLFGLDIPKSVQVGNMPGESFKTTYTDADLIKIIEKDGHKNDK